MWELKEIRELKVGRYMNIEDEPSKILNITTSSPGKHGGAKARIEGVGIFSGNKRSVVAPVEQKIQVPMIHKRKAQVISIGDEEIQLMDLETYETFHMIINEDHTSKLEEGAEIMYLTAMGRSKLM